MSVGEGGPSTWGTEEPSEEDEDSDDIEMVGETTRKKDVLDELGTITFTFCSKMKNESDELA